jgi:Histidine kinase
MSSARLELEDPRLLPTMLVPRPEDADPHSGRVRRSRRDWVVDVAVFAIALLLGSAGLRTEAARTDLSSTLQLADLVCGLLATGLLWLRRRWPVGVALIVVVFGSFSTFAIPATFIAVFTVAVHRRFAVAAAVAALLLATMPIYIAVHPDSNDPSWVSIVIGALLTGAVVALGMFVRARRQLVLSLRERAYRAETEQQLRVEQARQHERARIAREMHDVLAHRISLLSMHAGALEFRPDAPPDEIARAAGVVRASAHQALQDMREVIGVLREDPRDGDPRAPAADAREPPGAARRVPRGGHARQFRVPRRGSRGGPGRRWPKRLPDRPGGADERAQACPRCGGGRDARRSPGFRADG